MSSTVFPPSEYQQNKQPSHNIDIIQLPQSHSLEQPAVCSARQQSFTEHVFAAAEDLSVWTVMHTTRRRCGVL